MDFLQTSIGAMLNYPNLLQMIGVVGFLTYVIGFGLVQNEKVCGNGIVYPASKVFAAICVLISLVGAFNLASCLIQLSYIVIGLYGIVVRRKKRRLDNVVKAEDARGRTGSVRLVVRSRHDGDNQSSVLR